MPVTTERTTAARLVDPAVLARIGNLDLVARKVVDGFISGIHQAVNRGASTDFAEYRSYTPGDDVRLIDWRVYGRTDRLYIKTFEAETNADITIALDTSASMGFASDTINKFDYARIVAACLTHLGAGQRDKVGFAAFSSQPEERIPPAARHRDTIVRTLARLKPAGSGDLQSALGTLAESLGRRGIVIVISDFYLQPKDAVLALDELRVRGHDVIALHILDPMERDLALGGPTILEDLESGSRMPVSPASGDEYKALIEHHIDQLKIDFGSRAIDYSCFTTNQPLDHLLFQYLSTRARLVKTGTRS